jgi:hypothetical protein
MCDWVTKEIAMTLGLGDFWYAGLGRHDAM